MDEQEQLQMKQKTQFEKHRTQFEKYRTENQDFNQMCKSMAISCLNQGLLYQEGYIKTNKKKKYIRYQKMFTMSPSRNYFVRGFLWDEGFHNTILMQYDIELGIKIQQDWLDTQFKNGWIPREQMRGSESESFAPNYIIQKENEGNPPAFILALDALLLHYDANQDTQIILTHLKNSIEKIEKWFMWYYLQEKDGLFVWWSDSSKRLGFLGTGLDDYPRQDNKGNKEKYSLDLQVWMTAFAKVISRIHSVIGNQEKQQHYQELHEEFYAKLQSVFYDQKSGLYKSLFDIDFFEPFLGYVNLFPLFFGYIPQESLQPTLDFISDPQKIYSRHGLLSLSQEDPMYMSNDQYWTGPIWININYLVLRGLFVHYRENNNAQQIYKQLRNNLINTVCKSVHQTGFFWEQYNQYNGSGQKNHPFNGWTSLIALIIDEKYQ